MGYQDSEQERSTVVQQHNPQGNSQIQWPGHVAYYATLRAISEAADRTAKIVEAFHQANDAGVSELSAYRTSGRILGYVGSDGCSCYGRRESFRYRTTPYAVGPCIHTNASQLRPFEF